LNYVNRIRKKLISTLIDFILFFDLLPRRSPRNQSDRAPLTSPSGLASFPNPPPSRPCVFSWLLCVVCRQSTMISFIRRAACRPAARHRAACRRRCAASRRRRAARRCPAPWCPWAARRRVARRRRRAASSCRPLSSLYRPSPCCPAALAVIAPPVSCRPVPSLCRPSSCAARCRRRAASSYRPSPSLCRPLSCCPSPSLCGAFRYLVYRNPVQ